MSVSSTDSPSAVSISSFIAGLFFLAQQAYTQGMLCQIKIRDVLMIF